MITDTVCEEESDDQGDPDEHENARTQGMDNASMVERYLGH